MPNLTDELSTGKERRLNQFGTAVLVYCGKSLKFDRREKSGNEVATENLSNFGRTNGAPSESDVAPV